MPEHQPTGQSLEQLLNQGIDDSIAIQQHGAILMLFLNRPECRNAMNLNMVKAIQQLFRAIEQDSSIRAVVIRGRGGHFCAGGDIKDMAKLRTQVQETDSVQAYVDFNRQFGAMLTQVDQAPQTVVVVLEGAVLGGGIGLACVSDLALSLSDAEFALPETRLGLIPAQIAPFVLQRIGLTQTRRLALLGLRFNAAQALSMGMLHEVHPDLAALEQSLAQNLEHIQRCAPLACRATKALLQRSLTAPLSEVLDEAAQLFAAAVSSAEGIEGSLAFVQKRAPAWADRSAARNLDDSSRKHDNGV